MSNLEENNLPENWKIIDTGLHRKLSNELIREVPSGHVLYEVNASVVARREGRDDFLFLIEHPEYKYAEVHLTWSIETDPVWPSASLFKSIGDWKQELIDDAW